MKRLSILLVGTGIVFGGCRSRSVPVYDRINTRLAWNEDTVVNYRILFSIKDHRFWYTTEDTVHQQKIVTGYRGHYRKSQDTVYLFFDGKQRPPMCDFLIYAEGGYLSQQFRDHRKFMYLRWRFGLSGHGIYEYIF